MIGLPGGSVVKNLPANSGDSEDIDPWVRKVLWRRKWQPTSVFLPGKSHEQRSLEGYSLWGCNESGMTKHIHTTSMITSPTPLFYLVPAISISSLLLEYPALNWLLPLDCYNLPPSSNWAHSLISWLPCLRFQHMLSTTNHPYPDLYFYPIEDIIFYYTAAAAKSLQLCLTLCDPIDGSPPGSPAPGILQARTLEWVAISFSNAWKWKVKVKSLSRVWLLATPWTAAHQTPPSMGFSRQEYWSGVPLSSPR